MAFGHDGGRDGRGTPRALVPLRSTALAPLLRSLSRYPSAERVTSPRRPFYHRTSCPFVGGDAHIAPPRPQARNSFASPHPLSSSVSSDITTSIRLSTPPPSFSGRYSFSAVPTSA